MENIVLSHEEYAALFEASMKLQCLENAGVNNWEGYEIAMDEFNEIMSK